MTKVAAKLDGSLLPAPVGYKDRKPTLCIGLDLAWFGGSENDRTSQYDFLAAVLVTPGLAKGVFEPARIFLKNRDPDAKLTAAAIADAVERSKSKAARIILAIDAPLQATNPKGAERPAKLKKGKKGDVWRRACDEYLSVHRKRIDKVGGGAAGWHPNIQPGAPVPSRAIKLLAALKSTFQLSPWTVESADADRQIIECFPAEAIWFGKRTDHFPEHLTAPVVRAYKEQAGARLSATQVRSLVETTLLEGFKRPSGVPGLWPRLVEEAIAWMLADDKWQECGLYRGGKMLDDVVDSMICLATALSYAHGAAHVWQDPRRRDDGHIIGPGRFSEQLAG